MKKYGFTMVELIFVIVILGILAAVAVPRLNASRQDAQVAALKANIKTLISDLDTYLLANGEFDSGVTDPRKYTNVALSDGYSATYSAHFIKVDDIHCLGARIVSGNPKSYYLAINYADANKSAACKKALCDEALQPLFKGYRMDTSNTPKDLLAADFCTNDSKTGNDYTYKYLVSNLEI